MSKKIAVIGECMIELSEKGAAVNRGFGGDTLNTSVYIARQTDASALGVHYVTALGTDTFSQQMLESWQRENVQTDLIQRMADRLPGLYYIETDESGERTCGQHEFHLADKVRECFIQLPALGVTELTGDAGPVS